MSNPVSRSGSSSVRPPSPEEKAKQALRRPTISYIHDIHINGRRIDRPDLTIFFQLSDRGEVVFDRYARVQLEFGIAGGAAYVRDHSNDPDPERTNLPSGGAVRGLHGYSGWTPVPAQIKIKTPNFSGVIDCRVRDRVLIPSWRILPEPESGPTSYSLPSPAPNMEIKKPNPLLEPAAIISKRLTEIKNAGANGQRELHAAAVESSAFWSKASVSALRIGEMPTLTVGAVSISFTWDTGAPENSFTVCFQGAEQRTSYAWTRNRSVVARSQDGGARAIEACFKAYVNSRLPASS